MKRLSPTDLFDALDGRRLCVASRCWRIEIYGVFEQMDFHWLQLTLRGTPPYSLAVKIDPYGTAAEIADVLMSWLAFPSETTDVVTSFG